MIPVQHWLLPSTRELQSHASMKSKFRFLINTTVWVLMLLRLLCLSSSPSSFLPTSTLLYVCGQYVICDKWTVLRTWHLLILHMWDASIESRRWQSCAARINLPFSQGELNWTLFLSRLSSSIFGCRQPQIATKVSFHSCGCKHKMRGCCLCLPTLAWILESLCLRLLIQSRGGPLKVVGSWSSHCFPLLFSRRHWLYDGIAFQREQSNSCLLLDVSIRLQPCETLDSIRMTNILELKWSLLRM